MHINIHTLIRCVYIHSYIYIENLHTLYIYIYIYICTSKPSSNASRPSTASKQAIKQTSKQSSKQAAPDDWSCSRCHLA